jgi:superfamily II DNA or RNA helicase
MPDDAAELLPPSEVAPKVRFEGDRLSIRWDNYNLAAYKLFLKAKRLPEYQEIFDPGSETYTITAPARFAAMLGVPLPPPEAIDLPFAPFLKDDQVAIVRLALQSKRFADWKQCGLGKTLEGLEFARHVVHRTGKRFLIVTFNDVVDQWMEQAHEFYGDSLSLRRLSDRQEMRGWCAGKIDGPEKIAITNYEKFNPDKGLVENQVVNELKFLGGIALDEASRLKTGGGRQKWALVKSAKGIEYKLNLTATPAPNDYMEFASQGAFLEKMRDQEEIIWTFFTRDPKSHRWTIKKNARQAFFEWMSGWSIYVRDPRAYGWRQGMPDVPQPIMLPLDIPLTEEQREYIFSSTLEMPHSPRNKKRDKGSQHPRLFADQDTNTIQRGKYSQAAKGFVYQKDEKGQPKGFRRLASHKPKIVAELMAKEVKAGHKVLAWTSLDAETTILTEELEKLDPPLRLDFSRVAVLTGATSKTDRVEIIRRFRKGEIDLLITRARMLGYGLNFQFVTSMVFSGWSDSFEDFYQAIRRAYRFGQTHALRVHLPVIRELEGATLDNILRKQDRFEAAIDQMEQNYLVAYGRTGLLALASATSGAGIGSTSGAGDTPAAVPALAAERGAA